MQKETAEKKIEKIIKESKFDITKIVSFLPTERIEPFNNIMRLCGLGMPFPDFYIQTPDIKEEMWNLKDIYDEFRDKKTATLDDIINKSIDVEKAFLEKGVAVFPMEYFNLTEDVVKSKYVEYIEINYSPIILKPSFNKDEPLKDAAQKCQTTYFTKDVKHYTPIYIFTQNKLTEKDFEDLYSTVCKIINIYNEYVKQDFFFNKENTEYQHRRDYDPETI